MKLDDILNKKFFLDTNIFVYSFDSDNPKKQTLSQNLIETALQGANGGISFQVIQEFMNVATKKFISPMQEDEALIFLSMVLRPLCRVHSSVSLYSTTLSISSRYKYSFYDSLIIASGLEMGAKYLLTEDLQSGQNIEGLTIVNPY